MNILISACLLGLACRYNGETRPLPQTVLEQLMERYHLVPACPEQMGGLPTPRAPAERVGERVLTCGGVDVTAQYRQGGEQALWLGQRYGCTCALLKENSPSCGYGQVYDGTFSGQKRPGNGILGDLLEAQGITVLGESRVAALLT